MYKVLPEGSVSQNFYLCPSFHFMYKKKKRKKKKIGFPPSEVQEYIR